MRKNIVKTALIDKLTDKAAIIGIIGLDYVGLPFSSLNVNFC